MRLGAPISNEYTDPGQWAQAVRAKGYRAAYCPVALGASEDEIRAYAQAAKEADIVIAEVGAWRNNPLSPDPAFRRASIANCQALLALADQVGARCCVNIAGSRNPAQWNGRHEDNLTEATFDMVVEVTREIIDGVRPTRAKWALEDSPYTHPDSVDDYLRLVVAVDRAAFGVHFDPVNIVSSPRLYYHNGDLIRDFVRRLGPRIVSCHAKDIILHERRGSQELLHFDECRIGTGYLDHVAFLAALNQLDPDLPVLLEHLGSVAEYDLAAAHLRQTAQGLGIAL